MTFLSIHKLTAPLENMSYKRELLRAFFFLKKDKIRVEWTFFHNASFVP